MEVVRIKKILARNLHIFIGLHCVRRSSWTVTTLATLQQVFVTSFTLDLHMKANHKERQSVICSICKVELRDKYSLKKHMSTVHGESKNLCTTCGKKFKAKDYLKKHMLKGCGSGWKENKCTICKENFPSRSVTMEHIASKHKDFQLSKCSVCDTKFITEKSLNYHMIEKHEDSTETHICPFCGKHYAIKQKLSNHIATVHEGKYKKTRYSCTICSASYSYIKG